MRRQGLVDIAQESWTLLLVEASADDASQSPPVAAACGALYRVMTDSSLPGNHRYKPCFSSYGCLTEVSPRVKTQTPRSVTMWQKLRCSRLNTPPILCTTFAVMRELLTSACEFPLELVQLPLMTRAKKLRTGEEENSEEALQCCFCCAWLVHC